MTRRIKYIAQVVIGLLLLPIVAPLMFIAAFGLAWSVNPGKYD